MIKPICNDSTLSIKLLSNPKKFFKVKDPIKFSNSIDFIGTIEESKREVINTKAVDVLNLQENIAIILQTLKNKCIVVINPVQQDASVICEQLGELVANLRNKIKTSYDGVIGVAIGGKEYNLAKPKLSNNSRDCVDAICEFFEGEPDLPSTKILEQKSAINKPGINLYLNRNNIVLSDGLINDLISEQPTTIDDFIHAGEKHFEIFDVSKNTPISIVNEVLPSTNVPKMFLR